MKKLILLHNPRCSKSREAFNYLTDNKIKFEVREYLKNPLTLDEIKDLSKKLNLQPVEFIRSKESVYKEESLSEKTGDALMQAIQEFPILIERPILIVGDSAVIGRPLENIKNFLKN